MKASNGRNSAGNNRGSFCEKNSAVISTGVQRPGGDIFLLPIFTIIEQAAIDEQQITCDHKIFSCHRLDSFDGASIEGWCEHPTLLVVRKDFAGSSFVSWNPTLHDTH